MSGVGRNTRDAVAQREARIVELYQKGLHTTAIALRIGIRAHSVHKVLKRLGLREMSQTGKHGEHLWA